MNKKTFALIGAVILIIIAIVYIENLKAPKLDNPVKIDAISDTSLNTTIFQQPSTFRETASKEDKPQANPRAEIITQKEKKFKRAAELVTPDGYINLEQNNYKDKITISELIGKKVILIDFWTYSCINCQRTLPYITSWYTKYKDSGLEIIGVHTPEFEFEKKYENVVAAVNKWKINYPVVQDNNYWTWQAFKNRYWPRKYIIDIDGFIVYDHIGEGAYTETERVIQGLLEERKEALGLTEMKEISKEITKPGEVKEKEYSGFRILTPELYLAAGTNRGNFGNKEGFSIGQTLNYILPKYTLPNDSDKFDIHSFYFDGEWLNNADNTELKSADGKLVLKFIANEVNLVAGANKEITLKVKIDGKPVDLKNKGAHVNIEEKDSREGEQGDAIVKIKAFDLYNVYSSQDYGSHILELNAAEPGIMVYSFTFG